MSKSIVTELIKLGSSNPELQKHIRPVLDSLKTARNHNIQNILAKEYESQFEIEYSQFEEKLNTFKRELKEKIDKGEITQKAAKEFLDREVIPQLTKEMNSKMKDHLREFIKLRKTLLENCLMPRYDDPLKHRVEVVMNSVAVTQRNHTTGFEALDAHLTFFVRIHNENFSQSKSFLENIRQGIGTPDYFEFKGEPKNPVDTYTVDLTIPING